VKLGELASGLGATLRGALDESDAAVEIQALAYDSREVRVGTLFFCVSGFRADGHDFAAQAVERGAGALVVERPLGLGVPELLVGSARASMAPLASRFYGEPSQELRVIGITGTNGKTTTAYLVQALMAASGEQCGLLGTVKAVIGGREREVERTTGEAIDLQGDLRGMLDGGDLACAMEVSSHALELARTDGTAFAAAVFTNLTQDHLDFHPTMEDYFLAKRKLFLPSEGPAPRVSIVNVGDPYGRRLAGEIDGVLTYALEQQADYSAMEISCELDRCRFGLITPEGERRVTLPMPGRFNVANALAALSCAHALGGSLDVLVGALERGVRVPGRFEPVERGQDFAVLVDYAHTPDSLENVLQAARDLVDGEGRVICVFGAGGDRDRSKRPQMGAIAARLADQAIITSDNPRSEDPESIIEEIVAGIEGEPATVPLQIVDRRAAILDAVGRAHSGDILVIAGKGHEQGQEFAEGRKVPFDDATVAREALDGRAWSVAGPGRA
jgi:UDP-N-acetylmuramoyl-L-alanyl-D-glutamate--2,6-diaminopimelate ligase